MKSSYMGYICILLSTMLFSSMEVALKLISGSFNPIQLTATRFLVGALVLLPFCIRNLTKLSKKNINLEKKDLLRFFWLGLVGIAVCMILFQIAVLRADAAHVAVIFSSNPLFVYLLSYFILRENINFGNVVGLILDVLGIIVIIAPWNGLTGISGLILAAVCAVLFALYSVLGKKVTSKFGGLTVTCISFIFGCIILFGVIGVGHIPAISSILEESGLGIFSNVPLLSGYTLKNLPIALYVFIGVTGMGYLTYFTAIEKTSVTTASMVFFIKPVLAPILALIILKEAITFNMGAGILLIVLGSGVNMYFKLNQVS